MITGMHLCGFHESSGSLVSRAGLMGLMACVAIDPARVTPAEVPDGMPYAWRLREWRIVSSVGFVAMLVLLVMELV